MLNQIKKFYRALLIIFLIVFSVSSVVQAQDITVEFPGEIVSINGNIISVGGISVDVSDALLPADTLTVGMQVQIIGTRQEQTVMATIVVITDFGVAPTPVPPQEATPTLVVPTAVPTQAEATLPPTAVPTTDATSAPTVVPTVAPTTIVGGEPIIVIEGPVQAINVTSITIFDIDIEVDPSSTVLTQIRIGDTVRVEGASSFSGDTIIIVAVDITIIQTTLIVVQNYNVGSQNIVYIPSLPSNCKRTKKGKVTCKKKTTKKTT